MVQASLVAAFIYALFQGLGAVMGAEPLEEFVQIAVQRGFHLKAMDGKADAMVGDAGLREIVGADAFAAVAGAHLGLALLGDLLLLLALLQVEKAGPQHLQGLGLVFVLRFFILAG